MSRIGKAFRTFLIVVVVGWSSTFAVRYGMAFFGVEPTVHRTRVDIPLPPPVPQLGATKQPDEFGAVKNIYLASSALQHCPGIRPVPGSLDRYADENGVDIGSVVRNPTQNKYDKQRQYASAIVSSHIQIAGKPALCDALLQDFGPTGKLARGLLGKS